MPFICCVVKYTLSVKSSLFDSVVNPYGALSAFDVFREFYD